MTDKQIIQGFITGDNKVWSYLYHYLFPPCYATALGICKNKFDAEDAVQDAFLYLITQKKNIKNFAHIKGFMLLSTRNRALNRTKYKSSEKEFIRAFFEVRADGTNVPNRFNEKEDIQYLIAPLPPLLRRVVELKYADGYSYPQIAKLLNISPAYAKKMSFIGRKSIYHFQKHNAQEIK